MGIISGYPIGAKIAADFRKDNICSKEECERLLSFTNNSGPLFIIGTVGISMFGNAGISLLLFISHLFASITVGIIFRFWKFKSHNYLNNYKNSINYGNHTNDKNINLSNLGEIMAESISNSISNILMIGGFIIVFSTIISILNSSGFSNIVILILKPIFALLNIDTSFINGIFTGIFEITSGINIISTIHVKKISINLIFTSFLLGFGGISVMLQVLSIISKTDLSNKPYILGKFLHGIIAAFYTYVLIQIIPIFNFDLR